MYSTAVILGKYVHLSKKCLQIKKSVFLAFLILTESCLIKSKFYSGLFYWQVFSNSPAEGELQRGDVILAINGRDASTLTHKQAQDSIKFGGGQVELLVSR